MANYKPALFLGEGMSLSEIKGIAKNNDIKSIVINNFEGELFEEINPDDFKRTVMPSLKGMDFDITAYWSKIGFFAFDDEEAYQKNLEDLKNIAKICNFLKIKNVIINGIKVIKDPTYYEDIILEKYKGFQKAIEKTGISLLIYADKNTCFSDAGKLLTIAKGSGMKILFDASAHLECGEVPMAAYRHLKDSISMFVARDVDINNNPTVLGTGEVNLLNILRMGVKDKFEGPIILKPELPYYKNRAKYYQRSKIPGYNLFLLGNKEFKAIKMIDKLLNKGKKDTVSDEEIYRLQALALRKIIDRVEREK